MHQAARFRAECRQKILRVFGDVPGILEKAHRQRAAFPADSRLKMRLDELNASLVAGIAKMIASLLPTSIRKYSIAHQNGFGLTKSQLAS